MIEAPGLTDSVNFYMTIDPKRKMFDFYETQKDFDKPPAFSIDPYDYFPGTQDSKKFEWAQAAMFLPAMIKARKALEKNEFPDDISYCA